MAKISTYDGLISRYNAGYGLKQPIYWEQTAASVTPSANNVPFHWGGLTKTLPALPSGVDSYMVTRCSINSSTALLGWLFGRIWAFAQWNNATATFTDIGASPSYTELGVSRQIPSAILAIVAVATNSNAGTLTITYQDQDGNTAEAAAGMALPNSAPIGSVFWVPLNSPDWGAIDITNITRSGGASHAGTINFYGMQPLCLMQASPATTFGLQRNLITDSFNLLRLPTQASFMGLIMGSTSAKAMIGDMTVIGDST